MTILEDDIHEFIKQVHSSNSGCAAAQGIVYMPSLAANLKAPSFSLKDRASCNALYDAAGLATLDQDQLTLMKNYCDQALQDKINDESVTRPQIDVPKFTSENYDDFMSKFLIVVWCTKGVHGVSIDNLICEVDGNLTTSIQVGNWNLEHACQEEVQHFMKIPKPSLVYIVKQFQPWIQGFNLHLAFVNHFANATHL